MERLVNLFMMFVLFGGCTSPKLKLEDLDKCHQILVQDSNVFLIYLHDKWGENNDFILYNKNLEEIARSSVDIDPLPRIKKVGSDTVILEYLISTNFGKRKGEKHYTISQIEGADSIGKYIIIQERILGFAGNGLGRKILYDSVYVTPNFNIMFYHNKHVVMNKNISNYDFYKGRIFSDTIYNQYWEEIKDSVFVIRSNYLVPTHDSLKNKHYRKIYKALEQIKYQFE